MIQALKRKFILVNMLLAGAVVIAVFVGIVLLTSRSERAKIEISLDMAIEKIRKEDDKEGQRFIIPKDDVIVPPEGQQNDFRYRYADEGDSGIDASFPYFNRGEDIPDAYAFSFLVGGNGEIEKAWAVGTFDSVSMNEAISAALRSEKEEGAIKELGFLYKKAETGNGTAVAFASYDSLTESLNNAALISGFVCLGALLVLFGISCLLAEIVTKPVAEAWDRQKQFVADASHDLKTPLTVMMANNRILISHLQDSVESQRKWIDASEQEAERMRSLVDQMLDLAKSEDLDKKLVLKKIAVNDLCEQVVLQMEPVAFEKKVGILSEIQPLLMETDEETFVRLLHILLDNAVKYCTEGKDIKISLKVEKDTVKLRVENPGEKISEEDLSHMFERFYRADKSRMSEGHGLGLPIAKNLAEALGGKIFAESDSEKTVLTVFFKLK